MSQFAIVLPVTRRPAMYVMHKFNWHIMTAAIRKLEQLEQEQIAAREADRAKILGYYCILCKEARCTCYSIASHISIFLLSELSNHTHFLLFIPSQRRTFCQISFTWGHFSIANLLKLLKLSSITSPSNFPSVPTLEHCPTRWLRYPSSYRLQTYSNR